MSRELPDKLQLAPGFILLEILDNEEDKAFITEVKGEDKPQKGKALMVGPNTYYSTGQEMNTLVKVNDVVWHSAHGYEDVRFKGKKFRLCPFGKVLASYPEK